MKTNPAALLLLFGSVVSCCDWNLSGDCDDTPKAFHVRPDGAVNAEVVETNCGATTPFYTAVSLRVVGEPLPRKRPESVSVSVGRRVPMVEWLDGDVLRICWPEGTDVRTREESWKGIQITYEGCAGREEAR